MWIRNFILFYFIFIGEIHFKSSEFNMFFKKKSHFYMQPIYNFLGIFFLAKLALTPKEHVKKVTLILRKI